MASLVQPVVQSPGNAPAGTARVSAALANYSVWGVAKGCPWCSRWCSRLTPRTAV